MHLAAAARQSAHGIIPGDHPQPVQYRSRRFPQPHRIHQPGVAAACEAVGDQRRTLGSLLGDPRKSAQHLHRRDGAESRDQGRAHLGVSGVTARQHDRHRLRNGRRQAEYRLMGRLDESREAILSVAGPAAAEEHLLGHAAGQQGRLPIPAAGCLPSHRATGSADAVDDYAILHGDRGSECATEFQQDEGGPRGPLRAHQRSALPKLLDGQRRGRHFVRGSQIDLVELPVCRHSWEVDHAGGEHDGKRGCREQPHQLSQPADAASFTLGREQREPEVGLRRVFRRNQWKAVAGGASDQVGRAAGGEEGEKGGRVGKGIPGGQRAVQPDVIAGQTAQVDRNGSRVDADDAGTRWGPVHAVPTCSPRSSHGRSRRSLPHRARRYCPRTAAQHSVCAAWS
jgi:hypothetical protein